MDSEAEFGIEDNIEVRGFEYADWKIYTQRVQSEGVCGALLTLPGIHEKKSISGRLQVCIWRTCTTVYTREFLNCFERFRNHNTLTPSSFCIQPPTRLSKDYRMKFPQSRHNHQDKPDETLNPNDGFGLFNLFRVNMYSSRNKGKRPATGTQRNQQHLRLHFLKPIIRPACFKLVLPIGPDELSNWTPYINLVVPDGRDIGFRCFWKEQQNGSIALT
ncbi:hypothetical protein AHAS_Ahas14G0010700 [Arachis hypogaea]